LSVVAENIPGALREIPHWLVWRYVEEVDPVSGEVDWDKPPVNAKNGGPGSSTNPATWTTFGEAHDAYTELDYDGIGFVLHHSGEDRRLVGIDLDKCRCPETGLIDPWALNIIAGLDTYAEVSPSGTGVRLFLYGALPPHGKLNGRKKGPVEAYEAGRYVTVTGQHIDGTPADVEDRPAQLLAFYKEQFGEKADPPPRTNGSTAALDLDNRELLERAFRSQNGHCIKALFDGDASGYPSKSEADLALCSHLAFWFGRDADRIMQVVAESGLFRAKWQRDDYRKRTIGKAVESCREVYVPPECWPHVTPTVNGAGGAQEGGQQAKSPAFAEPVPASQLGGGAPPDYVWQGYVARNSYTLLISLWKAGKTTLLAHLLAAMGTSKPLCGLTVTGGTVLVVTEESARLWAQRRDRLKIGDNVLFDVRPFKGRPSLGDWQAYVRHLAEVVRRRDVRLVCLDTLAVLSPCDDENDAMKMMATLTPLHAVAEAGAAVLIVHHPRKGDGDQAQASRGSGALPGFVDVIVEVRRVKNAAPGCRRRDLTAYSRFDDTPAELRIELSEDGTTYAALGTAEQAVRDATAERRAEKERAKARQVRDDGSAVLLYLDRHDRERQGLTKRRLRDALNWSGTRLGCALRPLLDLNVLEECSIRIDCNGGQRDCSGVRRRHRDNTGT
jgi:hypothetical protein